MGFLDKLSALAGISARHNRALRDVKDWAISVQRFLSMYDLYGSPSFDSLFENIGEAKFDLTTIVHRARLVTGTAKNIKGKQVSPLIAELTSNVENLRRALINPSLHDVKVSQIIPGLLMSFEKLQDALSDIEYL